MTAGQLLRQMFREHEHLAADAEDTLRRVHDRVDGRREANRLVSRRRPFVVVATGIGVAAGIVGIITASVIIKADHTPVVRPQPGSQSNQSVPPSATSTRHSTAPVTVPAVDYLTVAAGYLPTGTVTQAFAGNGTLGELRNYVVTDGPTSTKVDLTTVASVAALPGSTFTGPGTSVQVAGHKVRQWSAKGRSRVLVTRDNRVTAVDVARTAMPAAAVAALARKVAGQLRYNRHDSLEPEMSLGYVPAGLRIAQLTVDNHRATTWLLGTTAAFGSAPPGANTQVYSTDAPPALRGPAGRTVKGHATRTGTKDGVPVLEVVDAAGHHTIVISGGPWAMSLSALYKIGDGLALG